MFSIYYGDCPYTGEKQAIEIEYFEIPMSGHPSIGYKKKKYSCPLEKECPYPSKDSHGFCPVYKNAPHSPS